MAQILTEYPRMLFRTVDGEERTTAVQNADEKAAALANGWQIKPLAWLGEVEAPAEDAHDTGETPGSAQAVEAPAKPKGKPGRKPKDPPKE